MSGGANLVEEFGHDEMHLAEVWLRRILRNATAVLHRGTEVRVTFDTESGDQSDRVGRVFRELIFLDAVYGKDRCGLVGGARGRAHLQIVRAKGDLHVT